MGYRSGKTKQDCTVMVANRPVTVPAGTRVCAFDDRAEHARWAVEDVALLVRLSGNAHDPVYRWSIVPETCEIEENI